MRWLAAGAASILLLPALTSAHVVLKPKQAPADSEVTLTFVVEHGCNGSPTKRLRIRVPDGVGNVTPLGVPGWKAAAAQTSASAGASVAELIWLGGTLDAQTMGEFAATMRLPDKAGVTLYFPATQECERGVNRWSEIPGPDLPVGALKYPAPALTLLKKAP